MTIAATAQPHPFFAYSLRSTFLATALLLGAPLAAHAASVAAANEDLPFLSNDPQVLCTTLKLHGEVAVFEGDIAVGNCRLDGNGAWSFAPRTPLGYALYGRAPRAGLAFASWPLGDIPFVIHNDLSEINDPDTFFEIQRAMRHWRDTAGITFTPRTFQTDYVTFTPSAGCSSWIGRIGGNQEINLAPACSFGNAVHEIGHALGYFHEQSRIDRDTYVTINEANIQDAFLSNFNKYSAFFGFDFGDYDYGSIMHYGAYAWSNNAMPTIETNEPQFTNWQAIYGSITLGDRDQLSVQDTAAASYFREECLSLPGNGSNAWRQGPWSPCVSSCGASGRDRAVHCVDPDGDCTVEGDCAPGTKPSLTQTCEGYLSCDFETDTCAWDSRDTADDADWIIGRGETFSVATGPSVDNTLGTSAGVYYYLESSLPRVEDEEAYLTSIPLDVSPGTIISFAYHTYGATHQPLELQAISCATGVPQTLWTSDGVSQDLWRSAGPMAVPSGNSIRFRFVGIVGSDHQGDVAIDDIVFAQGVATTTTTTSTTSTTTTTLPEGTCAATPRTGCVTADRASLTVKDNADDGKDQLKWKWSKGGDLLFAELGVPSATTAYEICIYDRSGTVPTLVSTIAIPPTGAWVPEANSSTWDYRDKNAVVAGVKKLQVRARVGGKSKVNLSAKGGALPLSAPFSGAEFYDHDPGIVVQMHAGNDVNTCWTSEIQLLLKNNTSQYKAKQF
jgi:hypothetical protein